jgi:quinol monooxygenase YgiN
MAYPTNALSRTLEDLDRRAADVKSYCIRYRDNMAAGNVVATVIIDLAIRLNSDRVSFANAANVTGLAQYAKDQKNNQSLDVIAEFNAMVSAIDGCIGWVTTNFPKDANGFLLRETWGNNGTVDRSFTPAQTAGLRTQLDGLIERID